MENLTIATCIGLILVQFWPDGAHIYQVAINAFQLIIVIHVY